jgi:predicted Zn-dependent protease with MMP-like domain
MTTVVVLPNNQNGKTFRAVSGENESFGETIGEALDALTEKLATPQRNAVIYIQDFRPDEFFTEKQQKRLAELMGKLREETISLSEKNELERLIEAELEGSGKRAGKLAGKIGK